MPLEPTESQPEAEALEPGNLKKRAAETILGDVDLRDELTDDEAQPLIDFGLAQVEALARRAAGWPRPRRWTTRWTTCGG